ncbi:hypothetical protein [Haloechinothrix halophila]|uniref:hypothetical protein n=1 Tax=Haloechinothrix halophila TaxID=1069073 RepID=UPI00040C481F|nr:hypothetical protein [Haloechinothrix halophila]
MTATRKLTTAVFGTIASAIVCVAIAAPGIGGDDTHWNVRADTHWAIAQSGDADLQDTHW